MKRGERFGIVVAVLLAATACTDDTSATPAMADGPVICRVVNKAMVTDALGAGQLDGENCGADEAAGVLGQRTWLLDAAGDDRRFALVVTAVDEAVAFKAETFCLYWLTDGQNEDTRQHRIHGKDYPLIHADNGVVVGSLDGGTTLAVTIEDTTLDASGVIPVSANLPDRFDDTLPAALEPLAVTAAEALLEAGR